MIYTCCNGKRAEAVRDSVDINAIDYLEVLDADAPAGSPHQQTLILRMHKPVVGLDASNVQIDGGTRIRPIHVAWAVAANNLPFGLPTGVTLTPAEGSYFSALEDPQNVLVVRTREYGDFSNYTLRLVGAPGFLEPPSGFDPILSSVEFSFKADCPTRFDCDPSDGCPPEPAEALPINYLAKDYASFRRLMLDRMALVAPGWQERNPADVGMALVELLAFAGDSLSYRQDAIATEAYLDTARSRVSVRRHARLVDYFMHDGANARCWVQIQVNDIVVVPAGTKILSKVSPAPVIPKPSVEYAAALNAGAVVFETMQRTVLYPMHNTMGFYTWGDDACVLCQGATSATLRDVFGASRLRLLPGDVLIFEEVLGPETGNPVDADPAKRHAVRLTKVTPSSTLTLIDGLETNRTFPAKGFQVGDPLFPSGPPIVHIEWAPEDALPFPLCVSAPRPGTEIAGEVFNDVSVVRGNIVLTDHGKTLDYDETLGEVPIPRMAWAPGGEPFCDRSDPDPVLPRFRPRLASGPVTQVGQVIVRVPGTASRRLPFDPLASATSAFRWDLRRALPSISVAADGKGWTAERELLDSSSSDRHFVVETEQDGTARLRFGDGSLGMRPPPASVFAAKYRIGSGKAGNVGSEVLVHLAPEAGSGIVAGTVDRVRNPLPASGGVDPETSAEVRQKAPYAFRTQERAVTAGDYSEVALRMPGLQQAAARFRWTGSWRTVFVTPDPVGADTQAPIPDLGPRLRDHLEKYRVAGYDLAVKLPAYVSLEIELKVCVKPGYFGSDVERELLEVFGTGIRPNGSRGLFHPDNFSFGQPVYLSPLYAVALAVDGVDSVRFTVFRRLGKPDGGVALAQGRILLDGLEIARLNNDRSYPEHGEFRVVTEGGL